MQSLYNSAKRSVHILNATNTDCHLVNVVRRDLTFLAAALLFIVDKAETNAL